VSSCREYENEMSYSWKYGELHWWPRECQFFISDTTALHAIWYLAISHVVNYLVSKYSGFLAYNNI